MTNCVFCKIVDKKIPAGVVYEDKEILAFHDINSLAPVHILIIPKKHIQSINHLKKENNGEILAGKLILTAQKIAEDQGIDKDGYKLLFRVGKHGQQEVPHTHLHLIGGGQLKENIKVA